MTIVTQDDFNVIPYNIPAQLMEDETFQLYADDLTQKLLETVLGYTLYDAFVAGWAADYPDQQWLDLFNGARYTYNGKVRKWLGLVELCKPYVFALHLRDNYDSYTGTGVSVSRLENSEPISPNLRITLAYNKAVGMIGNADKCENTLYGFLTANKASYPDWEFTEVPPVNRFNL
jgi:hypothetical protein